ncbi:hypothetical protein [Clostridium sp.]|jgi:hypothetical protein|uniref:hypothetical protein n=1 Tax=Clostridium sp. TaxID=1506 RepID=UPI00284BDFD8|nr:hypothetical protein [Clostridium sp.]MDR3597066.1 hypothetical protein [Clostridium sp.]
MRITKGLRRLENMGEIECNGDCDRCLYKHAKDGFAKILAMYDVLHHYGAISTRTYEAGRREMAVEHLLLFIRCKELSEGRD